MSVDQPRRARRAGNRLFAPAALAATLAGAPVATGAARAAPHVAFDAPVAMDVQTLAVLELVRAGDLARAAPLARALARRFPDFDLAALLHAELERVEALDAGGLDSEAPWSRELIDLLAQARARLELGAGERAAADLAPRALVALGEGIDHAVVVDLSRNELLLFARGADGHPRLVQRHYAASGSGGFGKRVEGDLKTPLGVYRIRGFRPDARLPALYGSGALTLDYPNALDRELGRTGSGIWLHGVPRDGGSRAPRSSEGCVTMPNARLDALVARLDRARTLVVLTDAVEWTTREARLVRRERLLAAAGLTPDAAATLVEVPGLDGGAPHLAVSEAPLGGSSDGRAAAGPGGGPDVGPSAGPGRPPLRFVPLDPPLQASLDVSP